MPGLAIKSIDGWMAWITTTLLAGQHFSFNFDMVARRRRHERTVAVVLVCLFFIGHHVTTALSLLPNDDSPKSLLHRRDALITVGGVVATTLATNTKTTAASSIQRSVVPLDDPPPLLTLSNNNNNKNGGYLKIPRVGYSLFKTGSEQTERCTLLALLSGVTHLDMATQYNNTDDVGIAIQRYLQDGREGIREYLQQSEKPELLSFMEQTYQQHSQRKPSLGRFLMSNDDNLLAARQRKDLFLSYKISNAEQSTVPKPVQQAVQRALSSLGVDYLDMVSIHSPLTDSQTRLATYQTLLELQQQGLCRAVGVCNYGMVPLQEIEKAGLPLPAVNQLELSPFNTHTDVVQYCNDHGIAMGCAAWSRLSSADGPVEQWDVLSKLAQQKQLTKAQILVRWALQKGYLCVPRSASTSKLERLAIAENSYGGVHSKSSDKLNKAEMDLLDGLNVNYPAGKLGRKDGWQDSDVIGPDWDPTNILVVATS